MPIPVVDLVVGTSAVAPVRVLVKQADFCHEAAVITVQRTLLPYGGREEDLPVQLQWGVFPGSTAVFYGYVHHTESFYESGEIDKVQLICLGATVALSQPISRSWTDRTADSVARQLVEQAYLSIDTEAQSKIWPFLAAADCTTWEYLVELAQKIGFILSPRGTEVSFLSADTLFRRYGAQAPSLAVGPDLTSFRPSGGGRDIVGTRVLFGMNQRDGSLFTVTDVAGGAHLGTETRSANSQIAVAVADSPGDGSDTLTGMAATDRFAYQATAEAKGSADFFPGMLIYVTGAEATQTGHWYVEAVEHDLNVRTKEYVSYLTLGRDALGPYAGSTNQNIVVPVLRQTPLGDATTVPPPSVLVNNRWRSSWARRAS